MEYYTVTLTGIPLDNADAVVMTSDVVITDPVLKGTKITVTAVAEGAEGVSYKYSWSNSTSDSKTAVYEIDSLNRKIICTVTGHGPAPIVYQVLEISIVEGEGYVEYSIGGSGFIRYTIKVNVPDHSLLVIKAFANDGYAFKEWIIGPVTVTDDETSFLDVIGSIFVEVYFEFDDELDIAAWLFLLLLLSMVTAVLFFILLAYFRTYEIIKVSSTVRITGEDRARRSKAYKFMIMGDEGGDIAFRVGDDEQWRPLVPDENGEYVISGKFVEDKLTIEHR